MTAPQIFAFFLIFYLGEVFFRILLSTLNSTHLRQFQNNPPERYRALLDLEKFRAGVSYVLARASIRRFSIFGAALFFLTFLHFRGFAYFEYWTLSLVRHPLFQGVFFIYSTSLCLSITSIFISNVPRLFAKNPIVLVEGPFQLYNAVTGMLLLLLLLTPILAIILWMLPFLGENWWFYAFGILLIARFFSEFSPLILGSASLQPVESGALREELEQLAKKANFAHSGFFIKAGKGPETVLHRQVYFSGLGSHKRVIFYQEAIRPLKTPHLIALFAHQIAHEEFAHAQKLLFIKSFFSFFVFYGAGLLMSHPQFYEAFGIVTPSHASALLLLSLFYSPLSFWLAPFYIFAQRRQEFQADAYAVQLTKDPKTFIETLLIQENERSKKLVKRSRLSDQEKLLNLWPHPFYSLFFQPYPTTPERIEKIEKRYFDKKNV